MVSDETEDGNSFQTQLKIQLLSLLFKLLKRPTIHKRLMNYEVVESIITVYVTATYIEVGRLDDVVQIRDTLHVFLLLFDLLVLLSAARTHLIYCSE